MPSATIRDGPSLGTCVRAITSTLTFPLISVINGAEKAFGARLEVTLPAELTLVSMSASNATCSGTRVLSCDFTELDPLATATVSLNVRGTATGNFVSALKLTASNDNNPANDNSDVAVEIAGGDPAAVSGGGSGGSGGGGRMEWLALILLLSLVLRRCLQVRAARNVPGGPFHDQNFTFKRAYQKPPLEPNGPPPLG